MSVISTIANYGGKIANNSVDIKQFVVSPIASTVQWLLKSIDATLTKYITPYSNSPVYINNLKATTITAQNINAQNINAQNITAQDITVYNFHNLSDVSLKENIRDIDEGEYDKILYLMPAKYNFKNDDSKKIHFGFIAQELEEFFPELVENKEIIEENSNNEETEKNVKTVNYLELIPIMINKIQDLQEQINDLKKKFNNI